MSTDRGLSMATEGAQQDPQFEGDIGTFHGLAMATDGTWIAPKNDYADEQEQPTSLDIDIRGNLLVIKMDTPELDVDVKITYQ